MTAANYAAHAAQRADMETNTRKIADLNLRFSRVRVYSGLPAWAEKKRKDELKILFQPTIETLSAIGYEALPPTQTRIIAALENLLEILDRHPYFYFAPSAPSPDGGFTANLQGDNNGNTQ